MSEWVCKDSKLAAHTRGQCEVLWTISRVAMQVARILNLGISFERRTSEDMKSFSPTPRALDKHFLEHMASKKVPGPNHTTMHVPHS